MKSLIFTGFLLMYSRKSDITQIKPLHENKTMKIIILLLIICLVLPVIFITYSPGSAENINIINIIFGGWFPNYMAFNLLDFFQKFEVKFLIRLNTVYIHMYMTKNGIKTYFN